MLRNLHMPIRTKLSVYCVFLLGLVDLAMTLTRFLTIETSQIGDFRSSTLAGKSYVLA